MLSIVIPAYNEEKRIVKTLSMVINYLNVKYPDTELIVVCDGCTDNTADTARSFKPKFKGLKIIEYQVNKGKGYAVKTGMLEAKGELRLFMDADYAVPIEYLERFKFLIKENDIIIGSRGLDETKILKHQMFLRELAGKMFGKLQKRVLNIPFYDTQCGFKLFRAKAAEELFSKIKYDCSYFDAELIYLAYKSGYKIAEAPVEWTHDGETRMPVGPARTFDLLKKLFRLRSR